MLPPNACRMAIARVLFVSVAADARRIGAPSILTRTARQWY
jgi:hypothetical protein